MVGSGPKVGSGGKVEGAKAGGPGLYMIEPSGLYWVGLHLLPDATTFTGADSSLRVTTAQQLVKADKPQRGS